MCPGCRRSKTPFVKTIVLPAARSPATSATASAIVTIPRELHTRRKAPPMARAIDADIVNARFDAEGVKQAVIIVREAVAFVDRDVYFICALDEIEAVDRERGFGVAAQSLRVHLLEKRVRAVAAHAVRIEDADAEHEIVG